ncbi:MAG: ABC transporter ATP-binding protein/permease [Bacilli bacterium]|nr:ABC transporter ATP-binding protein/permease [Bacilli bacterium]
MGAIALMIVDVVETEIPRFLQIFIDRVNGVETLSEIPQDEVWGIIWKLIVCAIIILVGRIAWRLFIFYASRKIEAGLRRDMFEKSMRLSSNFYHENKSGTIMGWFTTDIETIGEYFGWGTVMLIDASFLAIIVIIRMITVDLTLTLVAAIPIVLIALWSGLSEKFMAKKWEERQNAYDKLYDFADENFTGIRVIKAFVKEQKEIHAFAKIARKNRDVNFQFGKFEATVGAVIDIIIYLTAGLSLGFGGYFIYQAFIGEPINIFGTLIDITIGQLVEFLTYFDLLIWPLIALGQIVTMKSRAKTSLKRITRFLDSEEDVKSPIDAIAFKDVKGEITFKNLTFNYESESEPALKDVSFTIRPGETIGVVGKIGSGKSSLATLLLRLYNFEEGHVFIDGVDLMKADITSLRDNIAYAPQDNFLFSDSISNNIAFSSESVDQKKVEEAANFADIDSNIEESFPNKYETVSGERGITLSGGQKQRISLARAYYKNAPIMIMDDTVSAVDMKTEENILHNVAELRKGLTTIVIASRVSTVRKMDRILVMKDGTVDAFDTHENLMKKSQTYQNMVYLQQLEAEVKGGNAND